MSASVLQTKGDLLEAAANREELWAAVLDQLRLGVGPGGLAGHTVFVLALPHDVKFPDFCASLARSADV